jgi:UDP-N-acetylmuramoyl-L-alanyl-D-glutamate--2,6-diaminopimelate ligase
MTLCLDDKAGRDFVKQATFPCFTYSESRQEADLTAHDLRSGPDGLTFLAVTKSELARVTVPENALYDALAALACAAALQIPLTAAAGAVSELLRSEPVGSPLCL